MRGYFLQGTMIALLAAAMMLPAFGATTDSAAGRKKAAVQAPARKAAERAKAEAGARPKADARATTPARTLTEEQKIGHLLHAIKGAKDVKFIRNGKSYEANAAYELAKGKLDYSRRKVRTARDFINTVASRSWTTGRPYLVEFSDGRTMLLANWLRQRLIELERAANDEKRNGANGSKAH